MLKRSRHARIINMASIGGRIGAAGNGAYTSTKWAVIGMTKQAAAELGRHGITVNAIAPGAVNTPMYRSTGQMRSMCPRPQSRIGSSSRSARSETKARSSRRTSQPLRCSSPATPLGRSLGRLSTTRSALTRATQPDTSSHWAARALPSFGRASSFELLAKAGCFQIRAGAYNQALPQSAKRMRINPGRNQP